MPPRAVFIPKNTSDLDDWPGTALAPGHIYDYDSIYSGIGLDGCRAVIALRWDDGNAADYTTIFPLLTARSLVAGFAVVSGDIGTTGKTTAANLLAMQDRGMETLCHSATHGADPATLTAFRAETVSAAAAIRAAAALHTQTFIQPGSWTGSVCNFTTPAHFNTVFGRVLQDEFATVEAYVGKAYRPIPTETRWGVTIADMELGATAATVIAKIDAAVRSRTCLIGVGHGFHLGKPGYISVADLTTVLDYLQTKNGVTLKVLTPTAAVFVRPGYSDNLLVDPSFDASAVAWYGWEVDEGSPTVEAAGRTGTYAVKVANGHDVRQWLPKSAVRSVRFKGWAKAVSTNTSARVTIKDNMGRTLLDTQKAVTNAGWTAFDYCVGMDSVVGTGPATEEAFYVWLRSSDTNYAYWTDMRVEKT